MERGGGDRLQKSGQLKKVGVVPMPMINYLCLFSSYVLRLRK